MRELRAYLKGPQKPLLALMQDFNLRADPNGVCNGVAAMSALYFLQGKKKLIAEIMKFIYTDVKAANLAERFIKEETLSVLEWNAIAFLEGVELFQQAQFYREVHEKEGINHFNFGELATLFGFTGIAKVATHFNLYSKIQWQHYLQALQVTANAEKKSIAIMVDNHVHCINLCFDVETQLWELTNANQVPLAPATEAIATLIQPSFSALFENGDYLGVVSRIYLYATNPAEVNDFHKRLQQQDGFQKANQKCYLKEKTKLGITLTQLACYSGDEEVLAQCLDAGEAIDQKGPGDFTLAHYAAYNGNPKIMATLIAKGIEVNKACKSGLTPLVIAASYGHAEVITALAPRVNLEEVIAVDRTPLMLAAENGQSAAITALLKAGANLQAKTQNGFTALQIAGLFHHQSAVSSLSNTPTAPRRP